MSLFNNGYYGKITEEDIRKLSIILDEFALTVVKNKELEQLKNNTYRTPHDNDYIRIYNNLKNLLIYRANILMKTAFDPIEVVNDSYIALLATINNKKCYNEISLLADTILSLDIFSANEILNSLKAIEKDNNINIYDKLDYLKECVSSYREVSTVLYIKKH